MAKGGSRQSHRGGRWRVTDPHGLHHFTQWNFFVHIVEKAVLANCYYRNNNRSGRLFPQCGIFHNVNRSQAPPNPFKTWCFRLTMWNFPQCEQFHIVNNFLQPDAPAAIARWATPHPPPKGGRAMGQIAPGKKNPPCGAEGRKGRVLCIKEGPRGAVCLRRPPQAPIFSEHEKSV